MADAPVLIPDNAITVPQHVYQNTLAIHEDLLEDLPQLRRTCRRLGQELAHALRTDRMVAVSEPAVEHVIDPEITEEVPRSWWQRLLRRPRRYQVVTPERHKLVAQVRAIPQAAVADRG